MTPSSARRSLALAAILALGLLPGLACGLRTAPPEAGPGRADREAIQHLREEFVRAQNARDVDRLVDLFTEDAVVVPADDATCEGRRQIAEYYRDLLGQGPATLKFEVLETKVRGDWAFERIDATLTTTDTSTGEPGDEWDRYFWILERQRDGSWKITRLITNVDESDDEDGSTGYQPQT
jgi:uncharacterized protein (TIGR02246 family)